MADDGYHFMASVDGKIILEVDQPCDGQSTLTFQPSAEFDIDGEDACIIMPTDLWKRICESYLRSENNRSSVERAAKAKAKQSEQRS